MNCDTIANIFLKLVEIMKVISDQFLTRTNDIQGGRSFHELHETPGIMKLIETFVLYFSANDLLGSLLKKSNYHILFQIIKHP